MSLIGIIGIIASFLGFGFARASRSPWRTAFFLFLLFEHISSAVMYQSYVELFGGDALLYYDDSLGWYSQGFGVSTVFVIYVVQSLKGWFGGSILDYFLLFQAMGFWGLLFLMRTFDEVLESLELPASGWPYVLLCLPGIHFWTSAVGKDAPLFLACAMCLWGMMNVNRRLPAIVVALVIMGLIRAHVGLIAITAIGAALLVSKRTGWGLKVALLGASLVAVFFVGQALESTVDVDLSDPNSVSEYMASTSTVSEDIGADSAITQGAFPFKVFTLLFRPLFVDANGLMGTIASAENVLLLLMAALLVMNWRVLWGLSRKIGYTTFAAVFFMFLTLLLAMINYNVGLGLRQKTMLMPAFMTLFVTVMQVRHVRRRYAPSPVEPGPTGPFRTVTTFRSPALERDVK